MLPVFGADLSAPLFWDLNFYAEAAVSWGSNREMLDTAGTPTTIRDRLVPRVTAGFSRSFDVGDEQDKLMLNAEFYYNGAGYNDNMFEELTDPADLALFVTDYYSSGDYGQYYGALFLTVNKFILNDMTLTLSGIGNFSDLSFMAAAELAYSPVYNFTITFSLIGYFGENLREYTVALDPSDVSLTPGNNQLAASLRCRVKF